MKLFLSAWNDTSNIITNPANVNNVVVIKKDGGL